jgi:pyridinium-3,5-biscarboxylic acid mononucleotide synthase
MNSELAPSESSLRIALAGLFSDPNQLTAAVAKLRTTHSLETAAVRIDGVDLDLQRATRCGFPEVVFGEGKTPSMIVEILRAQQAAGQDSLVTRVRPEQLSVLQSEFADLIVNETARTVRRQREPYSDSSASGPVFVVTAGSSDRPVAEEAMETLRWMRIECDLIQDVGVAGPHRLLRHVARLQTAAVIVCVAGMDAALPSVLGGYVACPVIGVPTSVGYGASLNGMTAMLSMLTCCASNVVCVNIEAGFKGGYVAGLIASRVRS